ncbi:MAG: hypothetical protein GY832_31785 [Chloroflexi bacterium]|nr:hypothetical protein [Chloroflexota bacterium]
MTIPSLFLKRWGTWIIRGLFLFYLGLGLLGFSRLLTAVNQPFGGFIWLRDDVHGFSVGFESGKGWAGQREGLELDDRILRIQGREIPLDGEPDVIGEVYRQAEIGQLIDYEVKRQGKEESLTIQVPVERFIWRHLFESYVSFYAAGLIVWGIGLFVHMVSPRDPTSSIFAWMCLALSTLLSAHNFSGSVHKFFDARWTTFIVFAPVWPMFNALGVHFLSIFPESRVWWPRLRSWTYGAAVVIAIVYSYSFASWGNAHLSDPMLITTTVYSVVGCLYGIASIIVVYRRNPSSRVRQQIRIVGLGLCLGVLIPFLSISTYFLFRPYSGVWWSPTELLGTRLVSEWLLPLPFQLLAGSVIFLSFIAVAILRYRVFGAKPALIKAVTAGMLVTSLIVAYILGVNGLQALFGALRVDDLIVRLIGERFDWVWISNILATLATALLFTPLRDGLYRRVTRLLYPYRITVGEALNRLIEAARQAGQALEIGAETELPTALCRTLENMLYLEKAFIWFYFPATGDLQSAGHRDVQPASLPLSGDVLLYLIQTPQPLELTSSVLGPLDEALAALNVQIALPLVYQGRELVGVVGLSPRRDEVPFDRQDWQLLAHLAEYLLLLLKNVRTIRALWQSRERVSAVQEVERKRIAQELHDATLHDLSFLATVQLELCERAVTNPEQIVRLIEETRNKIRQTATELRSRLADISPDIIANRGLVTALESLVSTERGRLSVREIEITLHIDGYTNKMLPERHELAVFRCVQEALRNALQHAQASQVDVWLQCQNDWLEAIVADNGRGFDPVQLGDALRSGHLGLQNMRDRVETLGGEFVVESVLERGTIVRARVPLVVASQDVDP